MSAGPFVGSDGNLAEEAIAAGIPVVLVAPDPDRLAAMLAGLRAQSGSVRVAGFVGDPSDPRVMTAARDMADELFARTEQVAARSGSRVRP